MMDLIGLLLMSRKDPDYSKKLSFIEKPARLKYRFPKRVQRYEMMHFIGFLLIICSILIQFVLVNF